VFDHAPSPRRAQAPGQRGIVNQAQDCRAQRFQVTRRDE
jgi:hypothetical protein